MEKAHDAKSGREDFSGKPGDAANLVRAVESGELDRRIAALEASVAGLDKSIQERHARLITWIFSVVAFIVTVTSISVAWLGASSRTESREAAKEMKSDVKEKLEDLEKRFQVLAGQS